MLIEALSHWLDEAIKHIGTPKNERQEGYCIALAQVKEFIAQEEEIMDYESSDIN